MCHGSYDFPTGSVHIMDGSTGNLEPINGIPFHTGDIVWFQPRNTIEAWSDRDLLHGLSSTDLHFDHFGLIQYIEHHPYSETRRLLYKHLPHIYPGLGDEGDPTEYLYHKPLFNVWTPSLQRVLTVPTGCLHGIIREDGSRINIHLLVQDLHAAARYTARQTFYEDHLRAG